MPPTTPAGHDPLTPAVFHILLVLSEGDAHGYRIMRAVEETSGLAMGPGTVYGTLQRLEASGWVEEAGSEPGRRGGHRTLYALTTAGRRALELEAVRLSRLAELARARKLVPGEGRP